MVLRVADDRDAPAVGQNTLALRYVLECVVCSFRVNVGTNSVDEVVDGRLVEYRNGVYEPKRRNDLRPLTGGHVRAAIPLQSANLFIGIYPHDKEAAEFLCPGKVPDVTRVNEIKAAVRKNNRHAVFAFAF